MKNEEKQLNAKQKQSLVLDKGMEKEKELEQPLSGQKENKEINLRELHLRHVEKRPRQCQLSLIEIKLKAVGVEGGRSTVVCFSVGVGPGLQIEWKQQNVFENRQQK